MKKELKNIKYMILGCFTVGFVFFAGKLTHADSALFNCFYTVGFVSGIGLIIASLITKD